MSYRTAALKPLEPERVFCKDCVHWNWNTGDCHFETEYHPIRGLVQVRRQCNERNKNFDCPDFERKVPWWKRVLGWER